jgi:hypothetical protein
MKAWIKVYARPLGAEPRIYRIKPILPEPDLIEIEPGFFQENPWQVPDLREFETELEARRWMKEYYPSCYGELRTR